MYGRGDNARWSASEHSFSQLCAPTSSTLSLLPTIIDKVDYVVDVTDTTTVYTYHFTSLKSNNIDCNNLQTRQTVITDNTFPGTPNTGFTSGTPTYVSPSDSYFTVANTH